MALPIALAAGRALIPAAGRAVAPYIGRQVAKRGSSAVIPLSQRGIGTFFPKIFGKGAGKAKGAGFGAGARSAFNRTKGALGTVFSPKVTLPLTAGLVAADPNSGFRKKLANEEYASALGSLGLSLAGAAVGGKALKGIGGLLGGRGRAAQGLLGLGGTVGGFLGGGTLGNVLGKKVDGLFPKPMPTLPEMGGQAIAQGIEGLGELAGSGENIKNTLQDVGGLYAQGKIMDALGFPQADQYADMELRNYLGSKLLGQPLETIPNIGLGSGLGSLGQYSQTDSNYSQIINNPYKEQIKNSQGLSSLTDEDIMIFLADYNNGPTGKKSDKVFDKNGNLKPESVRMLMLVQALQQPTNLPVNNAQNDVQARNMQARMDIQNQLGGKFKTIDPNQLYPTYTQPNVAINNGMANGGEVARRVPDVSFSRYAQGGVANLMDGGAANGPGTGTSDSIPARLSDGEFVMTADAVRGMGEGDRAEGVRKMYELMNSLEIR